MRTSILSAVVLLLWITTASGQPPKTAPKAETPATITIAKPIANIRLREAVDYFADKHRIAIAIDSAGVAKGEKPFDGRTIKIGKMRAAPVGFLVECLAQAAGATSRKVGDKFVIAAGKPKDLATLLAAPSAKARAKAAQLVDIDRPIANLPLNELLNFVNERYEIEVFLDEVGFERVKKLDSVGERPIFIPPQAGTVEKLLESGVSNLGGRVVVREEMILIVPDGKPAG